MLGEKLGGEDWPSIKIAVIDSFKKVIFSWASIRSMKIGDYHRLFFV